MKKIDHAGMLTNNYFDLHKFERNGAKLVDCGISCGCFCYFYKVIKYKELT